MTAKQWLKAFQKALAPLPRAERERAADYYAELFADRAVELPSLHERMYHGRYRPEAGDGVKGDYALLYRRGCDHDHIAAPDAEGGKPARHSVHAREKFPELCLFAPADEGDRPLFLGAVAAHVFENRPLDPAHDSIISLARAGSQYAIPARTGITAQKIRFVRRRGDFVISQV